MPGAEHLNDSVQLGARLGFASRTIGVETWPTPMPDRMSTHKEPDGSESEVDNEGMNEIEPHRLERERRRTLPTPPSTELVEMVGDGPSSADFTPAAPVAQHG